MKMNEYKTLNQISYPNTNFYGIVIGMKFPKKSRGGDSSMMVEICDESLEDNEHYIVNFYGNDLDLFPDCRKIGDIIRVENIYMIKKSVREITVRLQKGGKVAVYDGFSDDDTPRNESSRGMSKPNRDRLQSLRNFIHDWIRRPDLNIVNSQYMSRICDLGVASKYVDIICRIEKVLDNLDRLIVRDGYSEQSTCGISISAESGCGSLQRIGALVPGTWVRFRNLQNDRYDPLTQLCFTLSSSAIVVFPLSETDPSTVPYAVKQLQDRLASIPVSPLETTPTRNTHGAVSSTFTLPTIETRPSLNQEPAPKRLCVNNPSAPLTIFAVRQGRKTGIFTSFEECAPHVLGYAGAEFETFATIQEANVYLQQSLAPVEHTASQTPVLSKPVTLPKSEYSERVPSRLLVGFIRDPEKVGEEFELRQILNIKSKTKRKVYRVCVRVTGIDFGRLSPEKLVEYLIENSGTDSQLPGFGLGLRIEDQSGTVECRMANVFEAFDTPCFTPTREHVMETLDALKRYWIEANVVFCPDPPHTLELADFVVSPFAVIPMPQSAVVPIPTVPRIVLECASKYDGSSFHHGLISANCDGVSNFKFIVGGLSRWSPFIGYLYQFDEILEIDGSSYDTEEEFDQLMNNVTQPRIQLVVARHRLCEENVEIAHRISGSFLDKLLNDTRAKNSQGLLL